MEMEEGPGTTKTPLWIRPVEGRVLTLAGLWQPWRNAESEECLDSYTILTNAAKELVASIHDRMPVVLPPEVWDRWLDPSEAVEDVNPMLTPALARMLEAGEVSSMIGNVRNDSAGAGAPLAA